MSSTIQAPRLVTNRDQARALSAQLPVDLEGCEVQVDCSSLQASTPSFVDELIKQVLVDRGAARLTIVQAPERTAHLAQKFAANHGVTDRLETVSRL